ncbi:MAG: ParB/RepB/Spo0J family partition protein [Planctomycetota bacterium]
MISRTTEDQGQQVVEIPVGEVRPNPDQPRAEMDDESLRELSRSIRVHGVLQPIIVQRKADGYELVAGERRLRACGLAERATVPALVIEASNGHKSLELALIENIQRENLNALDEATAYETLLARGGMSQVDLADRVGKSRVSVTNALRLLELPEQIKGLLRAGSLNAGQARAVLGAGSQRGMLRLAKDAVESKLSVREVERRARARRGPGDRRKRRVGAKTSHYEEVLRNLYGTKVFIKDEGGRGNITLDFYSDRDRDRLLHILMNGPTKAREAEISGS